MSDFTTQFIQNCLKTESNDFIKIRERFNNPQIRQTLKYYLEQYIYYAEQLDVLKKLLFYGKLPKEEDFLFDSSCLSPEENKIQNDTDKSIRLLHAGLGIATESAEFLQPLVEHFFENVELDEVNLMEELGDSSGWYTGIALDALGYDSYKVIMDKVTAKLKARFGDKFSNSAAINRDLEAEREILES